MAGSPAAVFRIRELELCSKARRLVTPFDGNLGESRGVTAFAEQLLGDSIADAAIVLHFTKRLTLLGVHRPPVEPSPEFAVAGILRAALLSRAAAVIYVHRRPTEGWADDDDSALVAKLRPAARLLGIELRDAVTIWSTPHELTFYSYRDDHAL